METFLAFALSMLSIVTTLCILILTYKIYKTLVKVDTISDKLNPILGDLNDSSYLIKRSSVKVLEATTKVNAYVAGLSKSLLGISTIFSIIKNSTRDKS